MLQLLAQMTLVGTEVVVNQQKWEYEAGWWRQLPAKIAGNQMNLKKNVLRLE